MARVQQSMNTAKKVGLLTYSDWYGRIKEH